MPDQFSQPIPGQSLTDIPRNSPWERPPEMVEPDKILEHYVKKLSDDELLQDLALVFELGGDLRSTTEAMLLIGTQQGLHTVEAGMIVAETVGTYIKLLMNDMGVNPKETNRDLAKESTDRENKRIQLLIKNAIESDDGTSSGVLEEMQEAAEPAMEMPEPKEETEAEPMGLMSRGTE